MADGTRRGIASTFLPRGLPRSLRVERYAEHRRRVELGPGRPAISLIDLAPAHPAGSLILVHGYAGCAETWARQLRPFGERLRVLAPDLRGHGQSETPEGRGGPADYSLDACRQDLALLLTRLAPPRPWTLVGHSWGGCIAAEHAVSAEAGLLPDALVLISTPTRFAVPWTTRFVSLLPTLGHHYWWRLRPRWNAGPVALKAMYRQGLSRWDGRTVLPRINLPCLVIVGAKDDYFPAWVYEPQLQPPGCVRLVVPGGKHKVQLQRPREVNGAIAEFIGRPSTVAD